MTYPPPGRELDAIVAERVMGAEWREHDNGYRVMIRRNDDRRSYCILTVRGPDGELDCDLATRYSTDIGPAFEVVEKMVALHWSPLLEYDNEEGLWYAHFNKYDPATTYNTGEQVHASAESLPAAICLAALRALDTLPPEGE